MSGHEDKGPGDFPVEYKEDNLESLIRIETTTEDIFLFLRTGTFQVEERSCERIIGSFSGSASNSYTGLDSNSDIIEIEIEGVGPDQQSNQ